MPPNKPYVNQGRCQIADLKQSKKFPLMTADRPSTTDFADFAGFAAACMGEQGAPGRINTCPRPGRPGYFVQQALSNGTR
jgi:hypothetical protein